VLKDLSALKRRVVADDVARHGALMVFSGFLVGLLGYLYQFFMGVMLPADQYGTLFSLISLSMVVAMFTQTFQTSTSRFVSMMKTNGSAGEVRYLWMSSLRRSVLVGLLLFLLLAAATPLLASFLNIDNEWYFIVLFSSLVFSIAVSVNQGMLQGLQRFVPLGFTQVLGSLLRLGLAVGLVYIGWGINGGLLPMLIGGVIIFGVSFVFISDVAKTSSEKCDLVGLSSYTGWTLLAVFAFAMLTNIDVILGKHYLSPDSAGDLSAVSVLGRMALYAPMGIGVAMFPKTSELFDRGGDAPKVLRRAGSYTLLLGAAVIIVYCLLSSFIIDFVFGGKYEIGVVDVVKYSLGMLLFSLSFLLMNYFLSTNQTRVALVLVVALALEAILVALFHSSVSRIVDMVLVASSACSCLMLYMYWRNGRRYQS
jgi:O-antigen/teichoic acid export membrane protein